LYRKSQGTLILRACGIVCFRGGAHMLTRYFDFTLRFILCTAIRRCGLRYARTKQKEEGYVPNRRRVLGAADIQASPASVGPVTQNPSVTSFKKRTLSDNDEPDRRARRPSGSPPNSLSRTSTPSESREDSIYDYMAGSSQSPSPSSYQQQQSLQASHAQSMAMTMD